MNRSTVAVLALFGTAILSLTPQTIQGQVLKGHALDAQTGEPVTGAFVVLIDAAQNEVARSLSDTTGAFTLVGPYDGPFRVRLVRIGYRSVEIGPVALSRGERVTRDIAAEAIPVELAGIVVSADQQCTVRPEEGSALAAIWEEVRKTLEAVSWDESGDRFSFETRGYERQVDAELRVLQENTQTRRALATRPYRSVSADELSQQGFIRRAEDSLEYFAPDAEVLTSDAFLDTHCYSLAAPEDGLLGLRFEPLHRDARPDIEGTFRINPNTAHLDHVEYRYVGHGLGVHDARIGGRIEFGQLPNGGWIVRRWRIRMPMAARRGVAWRDGRPTEPVVDAFREEGGEVLSIRQRTGELVFNVEGSVLIGTVWDSVAAGPLRQTYIGLAGTPYAARTNEDGQFRLDALPSGRYRLMLLDEDRALLGIDTLGDVRLLPADSQSVRLATPSFGAIAARICGQHPTREDSLSITYGVVADSVTGRPLANTTVTLTWDLWWVRNLPDGGRSGVPVQIKRAPTTIATGTGSRGGYRVCGLPPERTVNVLVTRGDIDFVVTQFELHAGPLRRQDIVVGFGRRLTDVETP